MTEGFVAIIVSRIPSMAPFAKRHSGTFSLLAVPLLRLFRVIRQAIPFRRRGNTNRRKPLHPNTARMYWYGQIDDIERAPYRTSHIGAWQTQSSPYTSHRNRVEDDQSEMRSYIFRQNQPNTYGIQQCLRAESRRARQRI